MYIFHLICKFFLFFLFFSRKVMTCCITQFPVELRSQGWQGGLIAATRDEIFWEGSWGSPRIREVCLWVVRVLQSG